MNLILVTLLALCASPQIFECARILGVIPTPSFSHQVVFRPIWNELSRRGHDLVVITTDPQNNPDLNLTEIDVSLAYDTWTSRNLVKVVNDYKYNIIELYRILMEVMNHITYQELLHPEVQRLLRNESEHFDLVMVEYLHPPMVGFAARFNAPYIGLSSVTLPNVFHELLGNPTHPAIYPDFFYLGYMGELSFWQRLISVGFAVGFKFISYLHDPITDSKVKEMVREQFGKNIPPLEDIMKNISLMLLNEDPTFSVRPVGPGVVLFGGGSHITPLKPLPPDLKGYLDGANEGFIYFSLGTNVKSDIFLLEQRKAVLDAFRQLPYKVLWKFDITDIPDVPDNVKISSWLPQQDILRHPNIKVFVTQGGLQSTEEAIFSHVPIVGLPYIMDQIGNVNRMVARGAGVFVDKDSLTTESFKEALLEVINNPKYKENIVGIAELSRDQPMTGIEKAVWWTEYVIRHKGARHFRNPAIDIPLYQYYFLDVIAFALVVLSVVLFIIYKLIVFLKNFFLSIFKSRTKVKAQ